MKTRMDKYKALRDEIELECLLDQNVFDSKDSLLVVKNDKPTYEQLEKALDKACKLIDDEVCCCPNDMFEFDDDCLHCAEKCSTLGYKSIKCWKDWLLK